MAAMEAKPADLLLCDSLILWVSDGAGEGGPSYLRTTRRRRRPPGRAAGCVGGVFPVRPAASPHLLAPPPLPGVTGGGRPPPLSRALAGRSSPQPGEAGVEVSSPPRGLLSGGLRGGRAARAASGEKLEAVGGTSVAAVTGPA